MQWLDFNFPGKLDLLDSTDFNIVQSHNYGASKVQTLDTMTDHIVQSWFKDAIMTSEVSATYMYIIYFFNHISPVAGNIIGLVENTNQKTLQLNNIMISLEPENQCQFSQRVSVAVEVASAMITSCFFLPDAEEGTRQLMASCCRLVCQELLLWFQLWWDQQLMSNLLVDSEILVYPLIIQLQVIGCIG